MPKKALRSKPGSRPEGLPPAVTLLCDPTSTVLPYILSLVLFDGVSEKELNRIGQYGSTVPPDGAGAGLNPWCNIALPMIHIQHLTALECPSLNLAQWEFLSSTSQHIILGLYRCVCSLKVANWFTNDFACSAAFDVLSAAVVLERFTLSFGDQLTDVGPNDFGGGHDLPVSPELGADAAFVLLTIGSLHVTRESAQSYDQNAGIEPNRRGCVHTGLQGLPTFQWSESTQASSVLVFLEVWVAQGGLSICNLTSQPHVECKIELSAHYRTTNRIAPVRGAGGQGLSIATCLESACFAGRREDGRARG